MTEKAVSGTLWDYVSKLGVLVGVLGPIVALVYYFVAVENRIKVLETQMVALAVSSSSEVKETAISSEMKETAKSMGASGSAIAPTNPIAQVCADLARRAVQAYEDGAIISTAPGIENLIEKLGCRNLVPKQ